MKAFVKENRGHIVQELRTAKEDALSDWARRHPEPRHPSDSEVLKEVRALKLLLKPQEKGGRCSCRVDFDSMLETPSQRGYRLANEKHRADRAAHRSYVERLHTAAYEAAVIKGEDFFQTRAGFREALRKLK